MFCGRCGVRNLKGSRFCESCGARLVVPIEERPVEHSGISRRRKKCIIVLLGVLLLAAILFAGWMLMDVGSTRSFNDAMDKGNRYLLAENLEQAEAQFLRAIEIDPREVEPYLKLVDIYMIWDEPEEAIAILEQGLEAVPEEERPVLEEVLDEIINAESELVPTPPDSPILDDAEDETLENEEDETTEKERILQSIAGLEFRVNSPAANTITWSTQFVLNEDGTFEGHWQEFYRQLTGPDYPGGTLYRCDFEGVFEIGDRIDDYSFRLHLIFFETAGREDEEIDGSVKIQHSTFAFGFDGSEEFILFLPGKSTAGLSDGFIWRVFPDYRSEICYGIPERLPYYAIYNVSAGIGFWGNHYPELLIGTWVTDDGSELVLRENGRWERDGEGSPDYSYIVSGKSILLIDESQIGRRYWIRMNGDELTLVCSGGIHRNYTRR